MACDCEFEAKINIHCVMEVVGIVRGGELLTKRAEVLKHAGCTLGCLGAYMDDEPAAFSDESDFDVPCTLEGCCDELEAQCGGDAPAMGPIVTLLIKQLIKLILEQIL